MIFSWIVAPGYLQTARLLITSSYVPPDSNKSRTAFVRDDIPWLPPWTIPQLPRKPTSGASIGAGTSACAQGPARKTVPKSRKRISDCRPARKSMILRKFPACDVFCRVTCDNGGNTPQRHGCSPFQISLFPADRPLGTQGVFNGKSLQIHNRGHREISGTTQRY